jgi:hypothetical protein
VFRDALTDIEAAIDYELAPDAEHVEIHIRYASARGEDANVPSTLHAVMYSKSFKALLTWRQQPFRKTHTLEELGEQCLRLEPALKAAVDRAVPLTEYAWKFRYPGEMDTPTENEARQAVADARMVFEAVLRLLPADVHP